MKKFNKLFKENKTKVKLEGLSGMHTVKEVNETRNLIKVHGYVGSFQRAHVEKFTNAQ